MTYFDSHTHLDTRGTTDYESMVSAGVTGALTLAHDFLPDASAPVLVAHFQRLAMLRNEIREIHGIEVSLGLGVHPRVACPELLELCSELEFHLKITGAVAVGETGLNTAGEWERACFIEQTHSTDLPVIAHTPKNGKTKIVRTILKILEVEEIDPGRIVIDHLDKKTAHLALKAGCYAGITVQPSKVTVDEAVEIITENSEFIDRMMVNSDMSSGESFPDAAARVAVALADKDMSQDLINRVCSTNAGELLGRVA